ncbi:MAG TPA: glycosyltransferase family 2 protein [Thermoanaerobaculia bacterium]|nr:glycosyltransferase family 2 protein [Thermoanaerobaculia bacterium]
MEPGLVSVILVTWNSARDLPRCLEALAAQTYAPRELIVVDNASADASLSLVASHATQIIRNETNRGFSVAVNQALRVARGEFVQLLNPDCFLGPKYIARLVPLLQGDVGMATGKLLRAEGGGIDSMGIRMTRTGRHLDIDREVDGEVFGVSGAAALYKRAMLDDVAINGEIFDEDFFAYREDADLGWRARLFGWRAVAVPDAVAHHVRRVTPEVRRALPAEINMHSVKNRFLLRIKNEGLYLALRNAPFELTRDLVVFVAALTIERSSLPAFAWLWRNRARVLVKRRAVQSRRRVSDRSLARWFR